MQKGIPIPRKIVTVLLICQLCRIVAAGIRQSSAVHIAAPLHAAEVGHLLVRWQEVIDGVMLRSVITVHLFGCAGAVSPDETPWTNYDSGRKCG